MSFLVGSKAIKRLIQEGDPLKFIHAKLSEKLFMGEEIPLYKMVQTHLSEFHTLPALPTVLEAFPSVGQIDVHEPSDFYLKEVENRFAYNLVNECNQASQKLIKSSPKSGDAAIAMLTATSQEWALQKYRHRVVDYTAEAHDVLTAHYFAPPALSICQFGWPYLDALAGGMGPGDVFSLVGRTGSGKTYQALYVACHNAFEHAKNVLFVSMEIVPFVLTQRVSAIHTHLPAQQVITKALSTKSLNKWLGNLQSLSDDKSLGKLYLVDGNLAANVDDIYQLAAALKCNLVVVDGAYLVRHPDKRLDRYARVAENTELIKQRTTSLAIPTLATWQFKSESESKQDFKKGGGNGGPPIKRKKTVDDIGYAPAAISQISSTILGLEQAESVETLVTREVDVMKGRNGEIGSFRIHWDFIGMNFTQVLAENLAPMDNL